MSEGLIEFLKEASKISDYFPKLMYSVEENGHPYVSGIIDLKDEQGGLIDSYRIKIKPTQHYPYEFPYVYELDNRIPKNIDWHIYSDGHCCVKALPEEILICRQGIALSTFIEGQVIPFFFNQKHRELYGYFIQERGHGSEGNLESLYEIFRIQDKAVIKQCLLFISKRQEPNRVSLCFCGSKKKYRKCHRDTYKMLCRLSDDDLETYWQILK